MILFVLKWLLHTERYRSGHNEAVLKTVWRKPQGFESLPLRHFFIYRVFSRSAFGVVLKWWRGAPAKGVGRVTGARVQISPTPPIKKTSSTEGVLFYSLCKYLNSSDGYGAGKACDCRLWRMKGARQGRKQGVSRPKGRETTMFSSGQASRLSNWGRK